MTTHSWLRFFALFLPLTLLGLLAAAPADAGGSSHPYFNDRGTLSWYHSFAEAKRVAQRERKLIFIEYGRRACSNCRKLASNVLPHSTVRGRMSKLAIGLAAECDRPEAAVAELFQRNLRNASMLPFCAFVTPRGRWITGWGGYTTATQMQGYLNQAEARHRMIFFRRPAPTLTPERAAPTPATVPKPVTAPQQPSHGYSDAELEADNAQAPCVGDGCQGGSCTPPSVGEEGADGRCAAPGLGAGFLDEVRRLFGSGKNCEPCQPTDCSPAPIPTPGSPSEAEMASQPGATGDAAEFPPPSPRAEEPRRRLASARALPRPQVRPALAPVPSAMPYGDPDGSSDEQEQRAPRSPDQMLAETAAKRSDWINVLRLTRDASSSQQGLRALNRQAHAWAHGRLAYAVRAVRAKRYEEAQRAMDEVGLTMKGEPESVDADRGLEAIEHMRDMTVLPEESPLRLTVRKTAYEKMRGTRWAPLFSDVPAASPALSHR